MRLRAKRLDTYINPASFALNLAKDALAQLRQFSQSICFEFPTASGHIQAIQVSSATIAR